MAEAFLGVLLENLNSLIQREIGLLWGVDEEMKKLSSILTTIKAVLEDAEDKQFESKAIRDWLRKLNAVAYEIDDLLDECATQVLQSEKKKYNKLSPKKILLQLKIGGRVKKIAKKLDYVAAERQKFHLSEIPIERQSQGMRRSPIRETGSTLNEPHHVFGRDDEKEKIVDILLNCERDGQQLSVLPIIGLGGLGKTTLAQLVYNDQRIKDHFEPKLWVCVSDNFDMMSLLKAMIASAPRSGNCSDLEQLDTLQHRLGELLNQKRYLLVLDDVWNDDQEKWAMLKNVLARGSSGASIVVTTRLKKVADIMGTLSAVTLTGLPEEHCWSLFKQRAFGQEIMVENSNLEAIGRQIVKKCAGVPLAAKTLGGLLRFKRKEKEWIYVKESEIWNLPQEETSILPALRLSYHHLPLVLRRCFAYCALFPKDFVIQKEELIFLWMAHGCISSNGTQEVEDVGDEVWNELVLRSLFQDVTTSERETTFKMHDLVHDLALSIMENRVVPGGAHEESYSPGTLNYKIIREVHFFDYGQLTFPTSIQLQVSTLTTLNNFTRLRMLNVRQTSIKGLPSAIGKLRHLRCLNLSGCYVIRTLPNTICGLLNLQILNLNQCYELVELPKDVRYMNNLRHLILESCISLSHMPSKIGQLTSLKTLSLFIVGYEMGNQLGELECLDLGGKLEIQHLERVKDHMDAKKASLRGKQNLLDLVLEWEGNNVVQEDISEKVLEALEPHPNIETLCIYGFRGKSFPPWMGNSNTENIIKIVIVDSPNCLLVLPLGDLPRLKYLELRNLAALEYIMEDEIQVGDLVKPKFASLEELELHELPSLKGWSSKGSSKVGDFFPNLQKLSIWRCFSLRFPPLSSLKELSVSECSYLTLSSFSKLENLISLELGIDETYKIPSEMLENLCNLKELKISGAHENCLPLEGLKGLNSLTKLEIHNQKLTCFPEVWLPHLFSLEELHICDWLPEFVKPPKGMIYLYSLKKLKLVNLPKMVCLPEVLQYIPALEGLYLYHLPELTSLPSSLGCLMSLKELIISNCPRVESLPSSIQGMTNLQALSIEGCPKLMRRYKKGSGDDWHKIAHIPIVWLL